MAKLNNLQSPIYANFYYRTYLDIVHICRKKHSDKSTIFYHVAGMSNQSYNDAVTIS